MIPKDVKEHINRFVEKGIPTGDFLQAVLTNDLSKAFAKADLDNRKNLYDIVMYVNNHTPPKCHGSVGNYWSWSEGGGLGRPYNQVRKNELL